MSVKRTLMWIGLVIFAAVAILAVTTSWYTVDESEQAVVITFGQANDVITEPGLHFKLPWPIQKAEVVSKETYSLKFGYEEKEAKCACNIQKIIMDCEKAGATIAKERKMS